MKKLLFSTVLGFILSAVSMAIVALLPSCSSVLRFENREQVQLCGSTNSWAVSLL